MICNICKKNQAKYHFKNLEGNHPLELCFCYECLKEQSKEDGVVAVIDDKLVYEKNPNDDIVINTLNDLFCKKCNTGINDINKNGLFGCDKCYEVFSDFLAIADAQINKKEINVENEISEKNLGLTEIQSLEIKLQNAIKIEDYEEAAKIRDEMKKANNNGKN